MNNVVKSSKFWLLLIILFAMVAGIIVYLLYTRFPLYQVETGLQSAIYDVTGVSCTGDEITISVKNLGAESGRVTTSAISPLGYSSGSCEIPTIEPGRTESCTILKAGGAGLYILDVSFSNAQPIRTRAVCPT